VILGARSISNGILHGRKNESAPFVFHSLKTRKPKWDILDWVLRGTEPWYPIQNRPKTDTQTALASN